MYLFYLCSVFECDILTFRPGRCASRANESDALFLFRMSVAFTRCGCVSKNAFPNRARGPFAVPTRNTDEWARIRELASAFPGTSFPVVGFPVILARKPAFPAVPVPAPFDIFPTSPEESHQTGWRATGGRISSACRVNPFASKCDTRGERVPGRLSSGSRGPRRPPGLRTESGGCCGVGNGHRTNLRKKPAGRHLNPFVHRLWRGPSSPGVVQVLPNRDSGSQRSHERRPLATQWVPAVSKAAPISRS